MKNRGKYLALAVSSVFLVLVLGAHFAPSSVHAQTESALEVSQNPCDGGDFLGFPKWYKYLPSQRYIDEVTNQANCIPQLEGLNGVWKIVAAVIELMTRIAALLAVGFIVYGGFTYTLSQGNPDKTKQSLKTIINAVVGLAIAIVATAAVTFVAGRF